MSATRAPIREVPLISPLLARAALQFPDGK